MPNEILMKNVESANLSAMGYDEKNRILQIRYNNDTTYQFYDFPPEVWKDLQKAESKGSFMYKSVRGRYRYARIDEQES